MNRTTLLFLIFFICCTLHVISGEQKNGKPEGDLSFQNKLKTINQAISVGDYSTALNLASEGLEAAEMERDQKKKCVLSLHLAELNNKIGRQNQAIENYLKIIDNDYIVSNNKRNLFCQMELGRAYLGLDNYNMALKYFLDAIDFSLEREVNQYDDELYLYVALIYYKLGDNQLFNSYIQSSIKRATEYKNYRVLISAKKMLVMQYLREKRYVEAREFVRDLHRLSIESRNLNNMTTARIALADYYVELNNLDSSLYNYEKALEYSLLAKDYINAANIYTRISHIFYLREEWDLAILNNNEALLIRLNSKSTLIASSYANLGINYMKKGEIDTSEVFLKKSLKEAIKNNNLKYIRQAYVKLIQLYILDNNSKSSISFIQLYENFIDSVNISSSKGVLTMQQKLNTNKTTIEKLNNYLLAEKKHLIVLYSVVFVLIVILVWRLFSKKIVKSFKF
ncbi:MAG: hypothetical protein PHQ65_07135 [Bacteroidales bacterium]|nr:hypothetical protein [Bacteroidales bacterium]